MSSVNKVLLLGRLGADPDVRTTPEGVQVASFSLATSTVSIKNGEKKEYTEWHRCSAFNKAAEIVGQYLKKGSQTFVEGSLRTRKWTDKEGIDRYTTEVTVGRLVLLGGKSESAPASTKSDAGSFENFEDDIPF
jgi:single-strand DNA-binding protein